MLLKCRTFLDGFEFDLVFVEPITGMVSLKQNFLRLYAYPVIIKATKMSKRPLVTIPTTAVIEMGSEIYKDSIFLTLISLYLIIFKVKRLIINTYQCYHESYAESCLSSVVF